MATRPWDAVKTTKAQRDMAAGRDMNEARAVAQARTKSYMDSEPSEDLTSYLNELHAEAGHPTMRSLSERIPVSNSHIAAVLKGTVRPSAVALRHIVEALDGDPDRAEYLRAATRPRLHRFARGTAVTMPDTFERGVQLAIGEEMRAARLATGMTMADVMELMPGRPVHSTVYGQYERGTTTLNVQRFVAWCLAIGVDPGDILTRAILTVLPVLAAQPAPTENADG